MAFEISHQTQLLYQVSATSVDHNFWPLEHFLRQWHKRKYSPFCFSWNKWVFGLKRHVMNSSVGNYSWVCFIVEQLFSSVQLFKCRFYQVTLMVIQVVKEDCNFWAKPFLGDPFCDHRFCTRCSSWRNPLYGDDQKFDETGNFSTLTIEKFQIVHRTTVNNNNNNLSWGNFFMKYMVFKKDLKTRYIL